MSIKSRLLLLTLGVVFSVTLLAYTGYVASRQMVVAQIEALGDAVSQVAAAEAMSFFIEREKLLEAIQSGIEQTMRRRGSFDADEAFSVMKYWIAKADTLNINTIFMVTKDNKMYDTYDWTPPEGYIPIEQPWFIDTINAKGITYSTPYLDEETGNFLILTMAIPIRDVDSTPIGVLAVDIPLKDLDKFVASRNVNGQGYGIMIDSTGMITSHPNHELRMKLNLARTSDKVPEMLAEVGRKMVAGENGSGDYFFMGSHNRIFFRPLAGGWSLGIVVPVDKLLAPARELATKQSAIGLAAIAVLGFMLFSVYRSLIRPLARLLSVMATIRKGDMTASTGLSGKDELADVAKAVDGMVEEQRQFFLQLRGQGLEINNGTRELENAFNDAEAMARTIAQYARELTDVAMENADAIQSVNAGIEEMSAAATGAANAASGVSAEADTLRTNAIDSEEMLRRNTLKVAEMAQAFERVSGVVRELDAKASNINNIVATITGIADQTNLLALNAAIEAARAGDAGRGFAVVAEEVRKLAEGSNVAASKIGTLAASILKETKSAVESASRGVELAGTTEEETHKTQGRLTEVIAAVTRIVEQIQSVAATSQEQSASLGEMTGAVDRVTTGATKNQEKAEQIFRHVENISSRLAEIATTTDSLRRMVDSNNEHMAHYTLSTEPSVKPGILPGTASKKTVQLKMQR